MDIIKFIPLDIPILSLLNQKTMSIQQNLGKLTHIIISNVDYTDSPRVEIIYETDEDIEDNPLLRIEVIETNDGEPVNHIDIEYLHEKEILELYFYLKSALIKKYPNI